MTPPPVATKPKRPEHPFRSAVLRGMGVVAPPLLTVVIFLWVGGTIHQYVMRPVTAGARNVIVWSIADIRDSIPGADPDRRTAELNGERYYRLDDQSYVPYEVFDLVRRNNGIKPAPHSAEAVYRRYVELRYLRPYLVVPFFLSLFILLLYLLGKFIAAGIGRIFWNIFERGIDALPLVRTVYSSVKQVSDFFFSPREIEINRVVAVEYPRRGIWSLGMVTGESMLDIRSAANEPVLSVLICTSPMPMTGFTVTVRKSETLDMNITIDQAFQFIVSCGVVVPPQQMAKMASQQLDAAEGSDAEDAPRQQEAPALPATSNQVPQHHDEDGNDDGSAQNADAGQPTA